MKKVNNKPTLTESQVRKAVREMILTCLAEMITEGKSATVEFPPYALELTPDNQISFKKNGKLFKSVDVKEDFGVKELIKLANTYAKKFNAKITTDTHKIAQDYDAMKKSQKQFGHK